MFRKSLKSLMLSLLCVLTLSCSLLVEEETGSISFNLPEARSVMHVRGNEVNGDVKYHVTITPENSNYSDFRYDEDNLAGNIHIDRVPIGKYSINVTAKNDRYSFFMKEHKPLSFRIYPGRPTKLQIELDCELNPNPEPQKPEVKTGSLLINFVNSFLTEEEPYFTLLLKDPITNKAIYTYENIDKNGATLENIKVGSYGYEIIGKTHIANYEYISKENEYIDIKEGENYCNIVLNKTEINPDTKPELLNGSLEISFSNIPEQIIDLSVILYKGTNILEKYTVKSSDILNIPSLKVANDYKILISGEDNTNTYNYTEENITINSATKKTLNCKLNKTAKIGSIIININNKPSTPVSLTATLTKGAENGKSYIFESDKTKTIDNLLVGNDYTLTIEGSDNSNSYRYERSQISIKKDETTSINVDLVITPIKVPKPETDNCTLSVKFENTPQSIISLDITLSKGGEVLGNYNSNSTDPFVINNLKEGSDYKIEVKGETSTHTYNYVKDNISVLYNHDNSLFASLIEQAKLFNITGTISNGPTVESGIKLNIEVQKNGNVIKPRVDINSTSYTIYDVECGTYSILINGNNDAVSYSGSFEVRVQGDTNRNISLTETLETGSIKGFVTIPENRTDLKLLLIAKNKNREYRANVEPDGSFKISDVLVGEYEITVSGTSAEGSYKESNIQNVTVIKNTENTINPISLKETLNKRTVILDSWANTSLDNAKFIIDLKKENETTSLPNYPITTATQLPYTLGTLEPGNYKVIVTGKGDNNVYSAEDIISVPMGYTNKEYIHKLSISAIVRTGSVKGTFTGDAAFNGITLIVTATPRNGKPINQKNVKIENNSSYIIENLPFDEYTIRVSSKSDNESLNVSFTGETTVTINDEKIITKDIKITSSNVLGNIAGTVTLPNNKEGVTLTVNAVNKATNKVENTAEVDLSSGYFDINSLPEGEYTIRIEGKDSIRTYEGMYDNITVTRNKRNTIKDKITLSTKTSGLKITFANMPQKAEELTIKLTKGASLIDTKKCMSNTTLTIPDLIEGADYGIEVIGENSGHTYNYSQKNIKITAGNETLITAKMKGTPKKGALILTFTDGPTSPIELTIKVTKKKGNSVHEKRVMSNETLEITDLVVGEYKIEVNGQDDTDSYSYINETFKVAAKLDNTLNASLTKNARKGSLKLNISNPPSIDTNLTIKLSKGGTSVYSKILKVSEIAVIPDLLVGNDYKLEISGEDTNNSYSFIKSNITIVADTENSISVVLAETPKENGKIQVRFTQGPSPEIDVTVTLYKGTSVIQTKKGKSSTHIFFTNLSYGNNYKIVAEGSSVDSKKYQFVRENIDVNSASEVIVDATLKENISEIKPDPNKGIFVVDAFGNDSSDGTKPFKTIYAARKKAVNGFNKNKYTVYVTSDITEPSTVDGGNGYPIAENVTITSPNNKKVTISTSLPFLMTYNNPSITLGAGVTINNTSNDKQIVKLGEKCKLYLQTSDNIAPDNYVNIQMGGMLSLNKGFVGAEGSVTVKMIGQNGVDSEVGGATGNLILETVDSTTLPLAEAVKKVNLISKKYILNSDGKIADKPKVQTINDESELRTACSTGGEYYLNSSTTIPLTSSLTVSKDLILRTNVPVTIQRSGKNIDNLINVNPNIKLSLIGSKGKEITLDGGAKSNLTAKAGLIYSQGNLDMDYCILQNNNNVGSASTAEKIASALYFGPFNNNTQATAPIQTLNINNCTISGNTGTAKNSAAIVLWDTVHSTIKDYTNRVTINNSIITSNYTKKGALLAEGQNVYVNLNSTNINNNTATGNGGGLNIGTNASVTLTNTVVENNKANANGNGAYLNTGELILKGTSVIRGNGNNDGALYVQSSSESTLNTTVSPATGIYNIEITKDTTSNVK